LLSTQRSAAPAIFVIPPARSATATSPARFTEVRDGFVSPGPTRYRARSIPVFTSIFETVPSGEFAIQMCANDSLNFGVHGPQSPPPPSVSSLSSRSNFGPLVGPSPLSSPPAEPSPPLALAPLDPSLPPPLALVIPCVAEAPPVKLVALGRPPSSPAQEAKHDETIKQGISERAEISMVRGAR
jgi:hypothetical protein